MRSRTSSWHTSELADDTAYNKALLATKGRCWISGAGVSGSFFVGWAWPFAPELYPVIQFSLVLIEKSRYIAGLLLAILLAGCGDIGSAEPDPTMNELRDAFAEHRSAFDQLAAMLQEDRQCANDTTSTPGDIFTVGRDKVCHFWKDGDRWDNLGIRSKAMRDATEEEMLAAVELSRERYARYRALFDTVSARRARHIDVPGRPAEVSLFVGGAGWVTSSYSVNIVRRAEAPETVVEDVFAYKEQEGYGTYRVYSPLGDGWYVELDMQW